MLRITKIVNLLLLVAHHLNVIYDFFIILRYHIFAYVWIYIPIKIQHYSRGVEKVVVRLNMVSQNFRIREKDEESQNAERY